jgi:16S rRNA (cytidine1402-2'-O)-methyltransferase
MPTGTLFVVATPIGNLEDITYRAVRILAEADYILCEDTRVTGVLLKHYGIASKLKRYDAHATHGFETQVCDDLRAGKRIALVSDAGTPGISDPGVHLVRAVREEVPEAKVVAVPGASSVSAAFSIAGIPGNQFTFLGFAPQKKGRQTFFAELEHAEMPVIFLESTHRIMKMLESLVSVELTKKITIAREMTKLYEEVVSGSAEELLAYFTEHPDHQKGEFVVIVS